jgi:hypothetical protein
LAQFGFALGVGLGPEHVRSEVGRQHRKRQGGRGDARHFASGQQQTAPDLNGRIDLRERLGVAGNLAAHRIRQRLQTVHGGGRGFRG